MSDVLLTHPNPPVGSNLPTEGGNKNLLLLLVSKIGVAVLLLTTTVGITLYFLGLTPTNPNFSTASRTKAESTTTTLKIMGEWYGEGERELFLRRFIQQFTAKTGVTTEMKFPREIIHDSNTKKIAVYIANSIRSNVVPFDIIVMNPTMYGYVAEELNDPDWGQKYLIDFSTVTGFTNGHNAELLQDDWVREKTGNIFVGPFFGNDIQTLYINTKLAEQIGLVMPTYDVTWDNFISAARLVSVYNQNKQTRISVLGGNLNAIALDPIVHQLLVSQLDLNELETPDVTPKKIAVLKNTFNQLARLAPYANSLYPADWQSLRTDDINTRFLNNEIVFIAGPAKLYNYWQNINPESVATIYPVQLPSLNTAAEVYSGTYQPAWAVLKNSPNKDMAIKFLMQYLMPETQIDWFEKTQTATMQTTLEPENLFQLANQFGKYNQDMKNKYGHLVRLYPDYSFVLGEKNIHFATSLTSLMQDVALGVKNPNLAFEQIQRQLAH